MIGNGVVIDLAVLFEEIDGLNARGIDTSRLLVSANAHVIPSYNRTLDKVTERFLGSRKIGTTGRGIGPTYADKMSRVGIRIQDLFDEKILRQKVEGALDQKNHLLVKVYNRRAITVDEVVEELLAHAERLRPMVADTDPGARRGARRAATSCCSRAARRRCSTSTTAPTRSSRRRTRPPAAPAPAPASRRPRSTRVIGIAKAYTTRVGEGPFPTELFDDDGEWLRQIGHEFGTTTGRPRRCGWYDVPIARYAGRVNGVTDLVLTKLDVLTGWEQIPVCVAYDVDGELLTELPMTQTDFHHAKPIFEYLPGWTEDISGARDLRRPPEERPGLRRLPRGAQRRRASPRSASAPTATRPSSSTTSSTDRSSLKDAELHRRRQTTPSSPGRLARWRP